MKILLSWLNEYGDFADPADAAAVQRLADTMTSLGLAVEEIRHGGATVDGVISAQVKRLEQHADAAKVQRVWVDAGDGAERHVWCGAFNMQVGDVVPLATLGTTMPDGRLIERRGILGIDSEGMLCASDELGLGRRPQRHPDPARRARRSACRTARCSASAPTCCSISTSRATAPTAGATSASPATSRHGSASSSACRRR